MRNFFILVLLVTSSSWAKMDEISQEILAIDCDEKKIVRSILRGELKAPKVLYHYGKKAILARNIPERNVPRDDWKKFIMGEGSTWRLKPSRRGLYGSSGLDTNFFLGETFVEITLKDECRDPRFVGELTTLSENTRFVKWIKKQAPDFEFTQKCHLTSEGYKDDVCEKWVNQYLTDHRIRIIYDNWVSKSFYIRDRSCIESMRGADRAREIIDVFTDVPALWVPRCQSESTEHLISYLLDALVHLKSPLNSSELSKLKASLSHAGGHYLDLVDAFLRCQAQYPEKISQFFRQDDGSRRYYGRKDINYLQVCNGPQT